MKPLVSVIIPNKNRALFLQSTIYSIVAQSYPNWELIVVDDESDDGSQDCVDKLAANESRIRWIRRESVASQSGGAQVCRNIGMESAIGDFILFLDSDDFLAPDCMSNRLAELCKYPSCDFVVGQCEHFFELPGDRAGRLWAEWPSDQDDLDAFLGLGSIPWQTSGPLWRRSALEQTGIWNENLVHVGHDHEFHVRALCKGLLYRKIQKVDYYWRASRSDSLSSFNSFKLHHANGGMIKVYQAILETISATGNWTERRRTAQAAELIKLATRCLLYRGTKRTALGAVDVASAHKVLSGTQEAELRLALLTWTRIFGRIPSLSWLARRFPAASVMKGETSS